MANSPKFRLPGLTLSDLSSFRSFSLTVALLLCCFGLIWRSQITSLASRLRLGPQSIQKLDSQKFIAGPFFAHPHAVYFFGFWAFSKALLFCPIPKSQEESNEIYESGIQEVISSKGPSKILPTNSLTENNILSHRRGLKGQLVGKFQNESIYNPAGIANSMPAASVNFSSFWSGFVSICDLLHWSIESVVADFVTFLKEVPENSSCLALSHDGSPSVGSLLSESPSEQQKYASAFALAIAHNHIVSCGPVSFLDGLTLSSASNLTPLEEDVQADISRSRPSAPIPLPSENPFPSEFVKQATAFNQALGITPPKISIPVVEVPPLAPTIKKPGKGKRKRSSKNKS
jgi:hypothetical protein